VGTVTKLLVKGGGERKGRDEKRGKKKNKIKKKKDLHVKSEEMLWELQPGAFFSLSSSSSSSSLFSPRVAERKERKKEK